MTTTLTRSLPLVKNPARPAATAIEWADMSFNPLRAIDKATGKVGWACVRVSEGCRNCYASTINAARFGTGHEFTAQNLKKVEVHLDEQRLAAALAWKIPARFVSKRGGSRPCVFVADMTDLFGEWVPFETIDRLFALFALRPDIDWMILTKRPERMAEYLTTGYADRVGSAMKRAANESYLASAQVAAINLWHQMKFGGLKNVWLGTSVEDQKAADSRIPHLLRCPAAVLFISGEPLLGAVDLRPWLFCDECRHTPWGSGVIDDPLANAAGGRPWRRCRCSKIHWVIAGGESGKGARPCNIEWPRSLRDQCRAASVAFFFKQFGRRVLIRNDRFSEWPNDGDNLGYDAEDVGFLMQGDFVDVRLNNPHGSDEAEWPQDLRGCRAWPEFKKETVR